MGINFTLLMHLKAFFLLELIISEGL